MKKVTIIGGYGVFGGRITSALCQIPGARVQIAGRNIKKARRFAKTLNCDFCVCDTSDEASLQKAISDSFLVIHAAGPFQNQDYRVPMAAIQAGAHYLDLADDRAFVGGIKTLNDGARAKKLSVISGASTSPALTDAMIATLQKEFTKMEEIKIAMSPGNRNPRGTSTIAAILSYVGRSVRVQINGRWESRRGWSARKRFLFPTPTGSRGCYLCEVPDLDLIPSRWQVGTATFHAGLEVDLFNRALAIMSYLRSKHLLPRLQGWADWFRRISMLLYPLGTPHGAFGVWIKGKNAEGETIERSLALVADQDGPSIPCAPAVVLARRLLSNKPVDAGAKACVGLMELDELMIEIGAHGTRLWKDDGMGWKEIN